ncbi:hypothetical protein AX17_003938 [Amanita inopinata Kibby_2008]|nr:hypothetical protein AX17_003938 [Amanita inopinata Kibby_2008]
MPRPKSRSNKNPTPISKLDFSNANYELYSEKEKHKIQKSAVNVEKDLEVVNATMDQLHEQQQTLSRNLTYYKAAVAPHKRLPDDVLREIFIACARSRGTVQFPLCVNGRHIPQLTLSHVCSTWRRVALSTGELWGNVNITYPWNKNTWDAIETWFRRAGRSPVTLELSTLYSDPTADFQKLFSCARITHLNLMITIGQLVKLSVLPDDVLPDVEVIRLRLAVDVIPPLRRLPSFLRLTQFFHCYSLRSDIRGLTLPWSQMRYFDIHMSTISVIQCLDLLRQMVSLEACRVHINEDDIAFLTALYCPRITLHNLQIFIIYACAPVFERIALSITAPQLKKLSLDGSLSFRPEIVPVIAAHLNLAQLEVLDLEEARDDAENSADVWLREAPSLRSVKFPSNVTLDKGTMSKLGKGRIGRCLEKMEVPYVSSVKGVLDMAESRLKNSKTEHCDGFQKVPLIKRIGTFICSKPERFAKRIDRLRASGVDIMMNVGRRDDSLSDPYEPAYPYCTSDIRSEFERYIDFFKDPF